MQRQKRKTIAGKTRRSIGMRVRGHLKLVNTIMHSSAWWYILTTGTTRISKDNHVNFNLSHSSCTDLPVLIPCSAELRVLLVDDKLQIRHLLSKLNGTADAGDPGTNVDDLEWTSLICTSL